jgi:hypothetical protein
MELTDRIKSNRDECRKIVNALLKVVKCDNSKRLIWVVELIELCSKNGDHLFHKFLGSNEFMKYLVKLLDRKRGKSMAASFYDKKTKLRWDKIENTVLYMI